jgi:F420-dependent oxidoreductase-like protein
VDIALMLEGQQGLNWPRWQRIAQATEDLGFAGLYRSDHFTNPAPPDYDSLELWVSLTWLASHTKRIEFGPMVAPVSFREPVMMARMASAVDDLSGGRLQFGLGAGWQEREHTSFGYDLLGVPERVARFEEALAITTHLLRSDEPVSFAGEYYRLHDAQLLPRPERPGGPPIVIGGGKRMLPLVAKYGDEWNTAFATPDAFAALSARLDMLLKKQDRELASVRRTLMTGLVFGRSEQEVAERARSLYDGSPAELRERGIVAGTASEIVDQLGHLSEAGVQRVMLQWLDLDDMDGLEAMAKDVLTTGH